MILPALPRAVALFVFVGALTPYSIVAEPLHDAAEKGDTERLQFLINQQINIDTPDTYGRTALHWAARTEGEWHWRTAPWVLLSC